MPVATAGDGRHVGTAAKKKAGAAGGNARGDTWQTIRSAVMCLSWRVAGDIAASRPRLVSWHGDAGTDRRRTAIFTFSDTCLSQMACGIKRTGMQVAERHSYQGGRMGKQKHAGMGRPAA